MEFDDIKSQLLVSKKIQYIEPMITVSSIKEFSKYFRQSLVLELYWENSIEFNIVEKKIDNFKKLSRLNLLKKFFSKLLRNIIK